MASLAGAGELKSGYAFLKPETRAMQDDDFANPGLVAVEQGQRLFNDPPGDTGRACAACHGTDAAKLAPGDIARYPVYVEEDDAIITLQGRIHRCQADNTGRGALPLNHPELLALETFVRNRAFGEAVNVQTGGAVAALLEEGEALYRTRYGLIDMACHQCHDVYTGQMIRGQKISQGQANGFPAYRLDTGEMANLHVRIDQCLQLMRAEPFPADSREMQLLQLFIMSRANGLPIETPAVRY